MTTLQKFWAWCLTILISLAIGAGLFWHFGQSDPVKEGAAVAVAQSDGSTVIARTDADPKAKPAQQVPKGAKVERIEKLTVTPWAGVRLKDGNCPPVSVDLSMVRMSDGGRRVVASSPQGEVSGIDIPVETPAMEEAKPWAVGLSYDPIHQTPGAWVERDMGRVRLGAELNQTRLVIGGPTGSEIRLRAGWSF